MATVPLKPTVELGDYRGVRLTPESVELAKDEVDTVIEQLRLQHAIWEPVERGADFDDMVTLDIESQMEGKPFISQQGVQYQLLPDHPLPVPGFAQQLSGMKGGEEKEFKLQFPKDYPREELAGKEAQFKVKVNEVKQQAARRAAARARVARWDLDVAVFLFVVLILVIILLFQEVGIEIVAPVAILGLSVVWLVGWWRGRRLYQVFYSEELAKVQQELTETQMKQRKFDKPIAAFLEQPKG